jgi:predicted RNA-binding Zn ribbon-like protein
VSDMEAAGRQIAPGDLELVRSFVNTNDVEEGSEQLADPHGLRKWLADHGLARGKFSEDDRRRAIELREALRALLVANNGEPLEQSAIETLNRSAERAGMVVRFDREGRSALSPGGGGIDAALGSILAIVHRSMAEGTWSRLKACQSDTCQWAFYDHSKNRSGTWCSMAVCGNRAKARTYRHRHRAAGE